MDEKKKDKEFVQNYFKIKENEIKEKNLKIKEKYKEENKMLKSINEEVSKKNKKQYDTLKSQKEKLEEKKKEKAKENLEQKKIRVNAIKKLEDKDKEKSEKESTIDKKNSKTIKDNEETINTLLSAQEKINYLKEKDLIEQYKSFCEELAKQEQQYMEKIQEAKKLTKKRSGSAGRIRVFVPKNKNKDMKDMKDRTKSSSKVIGKNEGGESHMSKNNKKLIEQKKNNEKGSNNIKKINTNEI